MCEVKHYPAWISTPYDIGKLVSRTASSYFQFMSHKPFPSATLNIAATFYIIHIDCEGKTIFWKNPDFFQLGENWKICISKWPTTNGIKDSWEKKETFPNGGSLKLALVIGKKIAVPPPLPRGFANDLLSV